MRDHLIGAAHRAAVEFQLAIPDPGQGEAPPGSDSLLKLLLWATWIAFAVCVGAVVKSGAQLAMASRGHGADGQQAMPLVLAIVGAVVTGSAAAIVTAVV